MACTYTGSIEGDQLLAGRKHLTKVTDMLCRTLILYEITEEAYRSKYNEKLSLPKDIAEFWKKHKELDAKRKKYEAEEFRKSALAKLSLDERKALGV